MSVFFCSFFQIFNSEIWGEWVFWRCFTLAAEEHDPTTELSRDRTTVCQFGAGVADSQLLAAVFQLNIIAQHDRTMNTVIVTD